MGVYSGGRTATLITHSRVKLPCEAIIIGTKGTMKLPFPMWTPTALEMPDNSVKTFPLPTGAKHKFNFMNSANMSYESNHVRECIKVRYFLVSILSKLPPWLNRV